jgi:hypothetical protein
MHEALFSLVRNIAPEKGVLGEYITTGRQVEYLWAWCCLSTAVGGAGR